MMISTNGQITCWNMLNRDQLLELRKKYLSPSLSLSYDNPLHIVRAEGQFLFDAKANRYLDAVNKITKNFLLVN